jgi:hypothetical protein
MSFRRILDRPMINYGFVKLYDIHSYGWLTIYQLCHNGSENVYNVSFVECG